MRKKILHIIRSKIIRGFLDCLCSFDEGVQQGFASVGHMIAHPIDTAIGMAHGTWMIADGLMRLEALGDLYEFNEALAQQKIDTYTAQLNVVVDTIKEQAQNLKARDVVRGVAGFATESYLSAKVLAITASFLDKARQKAVALTEKIGEALTKESAILKTVEGFEAKVGGDVSEQMCKMATEKITQTRLSARELIKNFNIADYNHEIGYLSKLEEAVKLFEKMPSALDGSGPLLKVLECEKKGLEQGKLNTARGAMYELERAIVLAQQGEPVIEFGKTLEIVGNCAREFDLITANKLIECKNINWEQHVGKKAEKLQSAFAQQQKIAKYYCKTFEVHTPFITEYWLNWFNKRNIKVIIG